MSVAEGFNSIFRVPPIPPVNRRSFRGWSSRNRRDSEMKLWASPFYRHVAAHGAWEPLPALSYRPNLAPTGKLLSGVELSLRRSAGFGKGEFVGAAVAD